MVWEFQVRILTKEFDDGAVTDYHSGLYVPTDPGAPDENSAKGRISLSFGKLFEKVSAAPYDQHKEFIKLINFALQGTFTCYWSMQCQAIQQIPS